MLNLSQMFTQFFRCLSLPLIFVILNAQTQPSSETFVFLGVPLADISYDPLKPDGILWNRVPIFLASESHS